MPKTLYIIDGHAHIYAAYFAPMRQALTSPSGEPTKATYIFTMAVLGLIEKHKPDMLVVAMDTAAPTFRSELYPQYKAHRPPMPDDMPVQIDRIEQILEALRIPILRLEGFEADYVLADKGYDGQRAMDAITRCGATPVVPRRKTTASWRLLDTQLYKDRNLIERYFNKIKHFRRIATRYDKLARNYAAFIYCVAAIKWIK